jgi:hypothetical protein
MTHCRYICHCNLQGPRAHAATCWLAHVQGVEMKPQDQDLQLSVVRCAAVTSAGLNGLIWVSPHIPRGEDGAPLQQQHQAAPPPPAGLQQQQPSTAAAAAGGNPAAIAAAAAAARGPSKQQREAVVRVAGAIRALAALMLQVYPDSIVEAYTVSALLARVYTCL